MGIHEQIADALGAQTACDARLLAPLTLAFIGDTVYDLYVRTWLLDTMDATPHGLHLAAAKHVCAAAQARAFRRIEPILTPEEQGVFKRGRNAHSGTVPKNASITDYHAASGLEALIGYLYLTGDETRLSELMAEALRQTED